jgi:Tfp pilus assembly PilM family ATPase
MRVAVECQSPLLQKSLELFLAKYLSASKKSDIIIRDEVCLGDERCFYVGSEANADLQKPFSKSQLILALEKKYDLLYGSENEAEVIKKEYEEAESMDFSILEKRIEFLTQEYQANILRAVKAFYEN